MYYLLQRVAEWQTRRTQNPLPATACGFDSLRGNKHLTNISENNENGRFKAFLYGSVAQISAMEYTKNHYCADYQ